MKKLLLILSLLIPFAHIKQTHAVEQSWAEKLLNPKMVLIGLGISGVTCLATSFFWYKYFDEEINEINNLRQTNFKLNAVCKKAKEKNERLANQIEKLKVYEAVEKNVPIEGISTMGHLVTDLYKSQTLIQNLSEKKKLDAIWDPKTSEWDFLDRGALLREVGRSNSTKNLANSENNSSGSIQQRSIENKQKNCSFKKTLEQLKKYAIKIEVKDTSIQQETNEIKDLMKKLGFDRESLAKRGTNTNWVNNPKKDIKAELKDSK